MQESYNHGPLPAPIGEDETPRDWKRSGLLLTVQPFDWKIGIDRSQWRVIAFDLGPFRIALCLP